MTLSVRIRHRQGDFLLDAAFESAGRLTALFGPSGSGKTSLINMIGGLVRPGSGRIEADGRLLVDTDARIFVPKHRRRIGYVFQDARLFPHMSVAQNLGYGRFFTPGAERYADFSGVVDLLGIGHLLTRKPASLSGGEKQRVAIGRALIASPKLILMDEPLASLDEARKAEIMPYIERLRDETKIPIVYVSHSVGEVARLATDVVVLSAGKVKASGPAADILARFDILPEEQRSEAGAMVDLTVAGQEEGFGLTVLHSAGGEWRLPRIDAPAGAKIRARVRARDVMLSLERPTGISALNVLPATIAAISMDGEPDALVSLDCGGDRLAARITRRSVEMLGLADGGEVFAVIKAVTFDRGSVGGPSRLANDLSTL
ncbi:molybdenum ABC transporter ATP-binding protein [Mesorhizobium sp. CN2-181]|uniref:molybdenum ABC transporter ATP-binding protein n=1 Tax=Mesorhizobium yinganensis TaxID=3157707 RepID=UPI0032B85281